MRISIEYQWIRKMIRPPPPSPSSIAVHLEQTPASAEGSTRNAPKPLKSSKLALVIDHLLILEKPPVVGALGEAAADQTAP